MHILNWKKLPFALRLLTILVAISLCCGVAVVFNTARVEIAAIKENRSDRLERTIDLLGASLSASMSSFHQDRRREILDVVSPIIYSNTELDLHGVYHPSHGWGARAWTRTNGEGSLKELFPVEIIEELIYSEQLRLEAQGFLLIARPLYETDFQTDGDEPAAFLIVGQDKDQEIAETLPRIRTLAIQLGALVLLQALAVAFFLDKRLRRPIQRISNRAEEIQEFDNELGIELSSLGELERIEKAIDMLVKSRAEYRHQEAYLRSILETMSEGILVLNDDANIVEVNQSFVSTWGYTLDDIKGKPIQTIFHPRHRPRYEEEIRRYKATGEARAPDTVEILDAADMNGREFPITYVYSKFSFGKEKMFVVTVRDISEQERQKTELIEAKEMAEQATAAKAAFLANMSHEIRTPMNGVMGLLDLVSDTGLNSQQSAMVKTAKVSAESLLNVLNDILDISKIEAGKIDLEKTEFELDSIVEEVVTLFHVAAIDKGLELSCYIDPSLDRRVLGDPTRVRQIASNIIGNAVKFTQEGEVEVRLEVVSRKADLIGVELSVRDTGIGMPAKALDSLFDPFSQADSSTTRKFGGTGLGMAISRQLVELMGGKISAVSEPGKGSRFQVALDLLTATGDESVYENYARLPDTKILVVDDNKTNREIISAYLSNWGIEYELANDASQALKAIQNAKERPFDVCLTDYHMPDVDGIELARKIKDLSAAKGMVVALLSSGSAESSLLEEVGISDSLNKPIRHQELFDLIARCRNVVCATKEKELESLPSESFSGNVLLVEDNKVNQLVAQSLLEKMGLNVDLVVDGEKALEAMRKVDYDLVLMDCLMPVMDGYESTIRRREYEANQGLERTPIVALTANAMSGDREKCIAAGMDDFLSKPIKLDEMKIKLGVWLSCSGEVS